MYIYSLKTIRCSKKILVTYAVQGEFTELKFPGLIGEEEVHIGYIRTGVGKVKSAYYVSEVLNQAKPDLVINVGTAGSIDCQVGDILVCRHFIDRDMQKLADMGLEYEIDSSTLLAEKYRLYYKCLLLPNAYSIPSLPAK